METLLETIIKTWLKNEFHNENALPSLVVSELAKEIDEHKWELYDHIHRELLMETILRIEEDMGEELTDDEISIALHRFDKAEDAETETLQIIIDDIIAEREEEK